MEIYLYKKTKKKQRKQKQTVNFPTDFKILPDEGYGRQ